jgi:hypothetical protein
MQEAEYTAATLEAAPYITGQAVVIDGGATAGGLASR